MNKEKLMGLSFGSKKIKLGDDEYLIKEMNAELAGKYESSLYKFVDGKPVYNATDAKTKLVLYTLHNLDGSRTFENSDLGLVRQLPAHIVDEIFNVASNINKLDADTTEKN